MLLIVTLSSILFFPLFLGFCGVGGVGEKICDFSINMGDRSQWIQHLGRKHWGYQH